MKSHRCKTLKGVILLLLFPGFHMAVQNYDVCNNTLEYVRVELWDTGTLSLSGSSVNRSQASCHFRMIGCDACSFNLQISDSIELPACQVNRSGLPKLPTCLQGCSHMIIYEPAYTDVTTRFYFSRDPVSSSSSFTSLSSSIAITLCHPVEGTTSSHSSILFHYEVAEKITYINGSSSSPSSQSGRLASPNFPKGYALRGELYTYVLYNTGPGGSIQIVFDDWDLAPHSRVNFFTNISTQSSLGTHPGSGSRPVLFVPGQYLYITFEPDVGMTSRADNMGFQATYLFLSGSITDTLPHVSTDCGSYYKYITGGNITFQPSPGSTSSMVWDCVWVILPHSAFDWTLLRLVNLSLTGNLILTVRSCVISDCPLVTNMTSGGNLSFPMTTQFEGRHGFYIRVKGLFTSGDLVSMVFAAFNRAEPGGCIHSGEFECMMGHCIDRHLVCDGHIHCDEIQDESITCKLSPAVLSNMPLVCKDEEFACANGKRCVPMSAVCDTWLDCQDGSDEYKCLSHTSESPEGIGDGLYESVKCVSGSQPCHHGRQCVSPELLCDGKYDCWDRSDEMHCALGFETTLRQPAPWRIVMPLGIALCLLLSLCVLALCLRTFVKQDRSECGSRSSSRSSSRARCSHRGGGRSARSVTSETPLTLDLSRSTSGVTAESPMPDSPPSYEEAMRRSPEGATAPNSADSTNQLSPSSLAPPAYHIPITGKQHFTFSTLWPLSSTSPSAKHHKRNIEEANLQLLASDFNSSSGNSEPGSTAGLNSLPDDTGYQIGNNLPMLYQIDIEPDESVITAETSSIGSVRECEGLSNGKESFTEYSPDESLHLNLQSTGQNSRASSQDRTPERKPNQHQCHCHCKGHDSRRVVNKRPRCRSVNSETPSCSHHHHHHHHHRHSCPGRSTSDVHSREHCVKNRGAKDSVNCDSHEEECLLHSEPDSPLLQDDLDDDDDDDRIGTCHSTAAAFHRSHAEGQMTKDVHCLVHENLFCDTVC